MRKADTRVRYSVASVRKAKRSAKNLVRSALCLLLIALMVISTVPTSAVAADEGTINASRVRVRSGAGTDNKVVATLNTKDKVTVLGDSGSWYKVKIGKVEGYVFKDYVTITSDVSASSSLRKGDSGSSVKKMQEKLIKLGYLSGKADGKFGDKTYTAVKLYQSRKGLSVDGVAGPKTIKTLNADSTSYNNTFTKLSLGSKGDSVKALQKKLIELKYLAGSADGVFGKNTVTAVKLYQKTNSLEVDGIAGPATQKKLFADSTAYKGQGVSTSSSSASSSGALSNGAKGDSVKKLQSALVYLGYLSGGADGEFGDKTEAAVRLYQKTNGLEVDGIAGKATQNRIYAEKKRCEDIVSRAKSLQGIKYVYGGSSTSGFDCSGLTMYVFGKAGIKLPHSSSAQSQMGYKVSSGKIRPGDLVGFRNPCGHVGVYIGGGMFIHAPQTGEVVRSQALSTRKDLTQIRRLTGKVPNN